MWQQQDSIYYRKGEHPWDFEWVGKYIMGVCGIRGTRIWFVNNAGRVYSGEEMEDDIVYESPNYSDITERIKNNSFDPFDFNGEYFSIRQRCIDDTIKVFKNKNMYIKPAGECFHYILNNVKIDHNKIYDDTGYSEELLLVLLKNCNTIETAKVIYEDKDSSPIQEIIVVYKLNDVIEELEKVNKIAGDENVEQVWV